MATQTQVFGMRPSLHEQIVTLCSAADQIGTSLGMAAGVAQDDETKLRLQTIFTCDLSLCLTVGELYE